MSRPDVACVAGQTTGEREPANENCSDSNPTIVEIAPLSEGRRLVVARTLARVLVTRAVREMGFCANDH